LLLDIIISSLLKQEKKQRGPKKRTNIGVSFGDAPSIVHIRYRQQAYQIQVVSINHGDWETGIVYILAISTVQNLNSDCEGRKNWKACSMYVCRAWKQVRKQGRNLGLFVCRSFF
jgi:hypothetical protein